MQEVERAGAEDPAWTRFVDDAINMELQHDAEGGGDVKR